MKAILPRFAAVLIPVLLAGCGLELLSPLHKLATSGNAGDFHYAWPVEVSLPLGTIALSLDDPHVARSLFGDFSVLPAQDDRLHLAPQSQSLDPIRFTSDLGLEKPLSLDFPEQTLPDVDATLPEVAFPDLHFSAEEIGGGLMHPDTLIPITLTYTFEPKLTVPPEQSDFTEALTSPPTGYLEFTVMNQLGVRLAPSARLYATQRGATREIGRTTSAVPLDPGESRRIQLPLHQKATLTPDLTLRFEIVIPGNQRMQAPVSGVSLTDVRLVPGTLSHLRVAIASRSISLAPMTLQLGLDDPLLPAQEVRRLEIANGSLNLTLQNGLPVPTTLTLGFPEIIRPGQTAPMREAVTLQAGETRQVAISLAGATASPQNGQLTVTATVDTPDTGPNGVLWALDGTQTFSGRLEVPNLSIRAVEVPVTRDIALPASSIPFELPEMISDLGFTLQDVIMWLDIRNTSALSGDLHLDVKATIPGKEDLVLRDPTGQPLRFPLGANQTNAVRITSANSNLMDLLNAKPSALVVGGNVRFDSKGQPVRLSLTDSVEGAYGIEIPLTFSFPPFGGEGQNPPIEVQPPTSLNLATEHAETLKGLDRATLSLAVENGWQLPVDLDLLFSAKDDPYSDPDVHVRTLSLGNAASGFKTKNELVLEGESLDRFRGAKTLGLRLRSRGTTEPVTLLRGSAFRVTMAVSFKARISSD